jgi:hypothetical protein
VASISKHGSKRFGSIEGREFIDKFSDCHLLKKKSAPVLASEGL